MPVQQNVTTADGAARSSDVTPVSDAVRREAAFFTVADALAGTVPVPALRTPGVSALAVAPPWIKADLARGHVDHTTIDGGTGGRNGTHHRVREGRDERLTRLSSVSPAQVARIVTC
ncbi:hypothetical protein [uncultured Thiodictyon sp.]|uniref:hypothetical protein n=1 Tax=uncultured Thiodictyon sp. TaxID=1846217 RepID=UPI0025E1A20C|nr:hypothetical protein [uncultured Thiodictyon sp.]